MAVTKILRLTIKHLDKDCRPNYRQLASNSQTLTASDSRAEQKASHQIAKAQQAIKAEFSWFAK